MSRIWLLLAFLVVGCLAAVDNVAQFPVNISPHEPASLPVANSTRSYWNTPDANPLAAEGSEGPLTDDADICIIGSGMSGTSAVYHLARYSEKADSKSLKVVVLEARDFCKL